MSSITFGKFSALSVDTGSGLVHIPRVQTVTLPDIQRETTDVTVLESSGSEFAAGGIVNSDASFAIIYDRTDDMHAWLINEANAVTSSLHQFKFGYNGTTGSIAWNGTITGMKDDNVTNKGVVIKTFTVKPSNGLTITR